MELVLVRNLCGTFCFLMQFVVFMDLLDTVVLSIAITLTYVLLSSIAFNLPRWDSYDIPIPTTRPPMATCGAGGTGNTIRRAKTLTRPERGVAPVPLIHPPAPLSAGASGSLPTINPSSSGGFDAWKIFSIM